MRWLSSLRLGPIMARSKAMSAQPSPGVRSDPQLQRRRGWHENRANQTDMSAAHYEPKAS